MRRVALSLLVVLIAGAPAAAPRLRTTVIFTSRGHAARGDGILTHDGQRIYYVREDSSLFVYSRATGRDVQVIGGKSGDPAASPDGALLAVARLGEDGDGPFLWTLPVDTKSGEATGALRRLTLTASRGAVFSPDGKSIAVIVEDRPRWSAAHIAVVPAAGGPERVLARTTGDPWPIRWAPDGRTLYYGLSFADDSLASKNGVYKIAVGGGTPQMVMRTPGWGQYPGLSPDGRYLMAWDVTWDSVVVATADGKRLASWRHEPDEETPDNWFADGRGLSTANVTPQTIHIRSLINGSTRAVTDTNWEAHSPEWSRDGRRLAAISRHPNGVAISNADGTGRKLIPGHFPNINTGLAWSPDGRSIAYRSNTASGELYVVDISRGTEKQLPSTTTVRGPLRWDSDSKAILYASADTALPPDSIKQVTVHELQLTGADRVLRTVRLRCNRLTCLAKFVNDSLLMAWAIGTDYDYVLYNLHRRDEGHVVYTRPPGAQPVPTFSADGRWVAVRHPTPEGESRMIEVMSVDGSGRRTVTLPFVTQPGERNPWISPDGQELIVTTPGARARGDGQGPAEVSFYRVTVGTGAVVKLAGVPPGSRAWESAVSPDGRWVAHGIPGTPSVTFYEIDAAPFLKSLGTGAKK